jgi:hypothetical protein
VRWMTAAIRLRVQSCPREPEASGPGSSQAGSCASWSAVNRRGATARRAACGAGAPRSPRNASGFDRGARLARLTTPAPLTTLARQRLAGSPVAARLRLLERLDSMGGPLEARALLEALS